MNLVWLKTTDLRIKDNPALIKSLKNNKTIIIFCVSPKLFCKNNIIKIKNLDNSKKGFIRIINRFI